MMFKDNAQKILDVLGKSIDKGVIQATELGEALTKIETSFAHGHSTTEHLKDDATNHAVDHSHDQVGSVSFFSRAFPLMEMIREAQKMGASISWGV